MKVQVLNNSIQVGFGPISEFMVSRSSFLFNHLECTIIFQQALAMVETVEDGFVSHFATKPLLSCQLIRDREFQLVNGNDTKVK